jgi:ribonuclease BN (tRNA processing enzyme)
VTGRAGSADARVTILGSGTLVPNASRHSAAHLVETGGALLLMDCGPGSLHGLAEHGVDWKALTHVAISHYHNDHVGDLSALLFALKWNVGPARGDEPLTLVGPVGFGAFLKRLAEAHGDHVLDPGFPLNVVEVDEGSGLEDLARGLGLRCLSTPHTAESIAFRVETAVGAVSYTGDTGPSETLGSFLRGSRVLIAECALTDPPEMELHLSPRGLAALALEAEPDLLVVTHVYPPTVPEDAARGVVGAGFDGTVVAGRDGLAICVTTTGVAVDP